MEFRKGKRGKKKHANLGKGRVGRISTLMGAGKKPVRTKGKTRTL